MKKVSPRFDPLDIVANETRYFVRRTNAVLKNRSSAYRNSNLHSQRNPTEEQRCPKLLVISEDLTESLDGMERTTLPS